MRWFFECDEALMRGIRIVGEDLEIDAVEARRAELRVSARVMEGQLLFVELNGKEATIAYGGGAARFFRGLAILADWERPEGA